jgi:hypothetical protein
MLRFREDLLQFIWKNRLFKPIPMISTKGLEIQIVKPGVHNRDSGPDFFNAHIKVSGLELAGNIELHLKTSDWLKHRHQNDRNYDNIILHAVYEHDLELDQNTFNNVEVLELKPLIAQETLETYNTIYRTENKLPCSGLLSKVDDFKCNNWLERMRIERLEEKIKKTNLLLESSGGDYTQTFYTLFLRNYGFKVNSVPFELLAGQLPLALLLKHSDDLEQLEALLLGMAGMLDEQFSEQYLCRLQNEFTFLKKKYGLVPLKKELFKYSKLRPANFPNLRLMQFAALVHNKPELFSGPHLFKDFKQLKAALQTKLKSYWENHYTLGGDTHSKKMNLGADSIEILIINTFVPFLFFYAKQTSRIEFADASFELLKNCRFENNSKTRLFSERKSLFENAGQSQGIIHLYDHYCSKKLCLQCGIAASFLKPDLKTG